MNMSIPSDARVDARAGVRGRRAVVVVRRAAAWALIRRPLPPRARPRRARPAGPCPSRSRWTTSLRSQLERASPGNVETMISSTRSSWTACIAAVYGSGCAIWPCASMPAPRSAASVRRRRRSASGCPAVCRSLCGADDQEARRRPRRALLDLREQRLVRDRLVRDHEHVRLAALLASRSTTTCSTGMAPGDLLDPLDDVLAASSRTRLGVGRDDDLVHRRLELGERVAHRVHRVGLDDEAVRRDPRSRGAGPASCRAGAARPPAGVSW